MALEARCLAPLNMTGEWAVDATGAGCVRNDKRGLPPVTPGLIPYESERTADTRLENVWKRA